VITQYLLPYLGPNRYCI